jgi:hypothetical protein
MAKMTVSDPTGVEWSVQRWWFKTIPYETGIDFLDFIIFVIVLPFMIVWPFWLLLKWLGVRWSIEIRRDGTKVGEEKVRGWGNSGRRIQELSQAAAAGTLTQYAAAS